MVALEIRFPAGRFHATPWGRHVNEGITEWPISPWRFLRALVAVAYRTDAPRSADTLKSLVENLASALPSFQLPQANSGHTRHYMPLYRSAIDGKTTKVFDTFIALEKDVSLKMVWPEVNLTADQQELLTSLLSGITYLGRAESWVEIVQAEDWDGIFNAYPLAVDGQPSEEEELVRLACPSPEGFQELLEQSKNDHGAGNRKNNVLPESFFPALCAESGDLQKAGWSQPPGLKWVDYVRPRNCFSADYQTERSSSAVFPTVVRFAIASRVPPLFTNAITVGEKLREALLRWSDSEEVFLGRNDNVPSNDPQHLHAFFQPEDADKDGYIDHITVHAEMGFNRKALSALTRIEKVWGAGGHDLYLALIGVGRACDFAGPYPERSPFFLHSKTWRSITPYVPAGHLKIKRSHRKDLDLMRDALLREINRELKRRNQPLALDLELVAPLEMGGRKISWLKFRSHRYGGGGQRGDSGSFGIQLTFENAVSGPISLGYACHFGLGAFVPAA